MENKGSVLASGLNLSLIYIEYIQVEIINYVSNYIVDDLNLDIFYVYPS